MKTHKKAFTLVELLIVCTIIVILSAIAVVNFGIAKQKSRDATRKKDLSEIAAALETYKVDNKEYPSNSNFANISRNTLDELVPSYIVALPTDPKTSDDKYQYKGDPVQYKVRSIHGERVTASNAGDFLDPTNNSYLQVSNTEVARNW